LLNSTQAYLRYHSASDYIHQRQTAFPADHGEFSVQPLRLPVCMIKPFLNACAVLAVGKQNRISDD